MKKRNVKTMDVILVVIAIFLLLFIIAMIWLFSSQGAIPDTLVTCVFVICGGECGVMGWIKTTKEKQQERRNVLSDRRHNEKLNSGNRPEEKEDL